MQKIIPHLWFDSEAEEAAKFYAGLLEDSSIGKKTYYGKAGFEIHGQPEGKLMTIEFELAGQKFMGLNGGPYFKFTPAVSFLIACQTKEEVETLWKALSAGGMPLMELGEYPFSEKYGWIQDKYGVSWQIMFMGSYEIKQKITPTLMFVGEQCGRAEEAMTFYTSVFHTTKIGDIMRYPKGAEPEKEGTIAHASFTLEGQDFAAMDSAQKHEFAFNEAISFLVRCETQEEIDYYWDKLTPGGDPKAQQCGWLKDKFGVSWQIAPAILEQMLQDPDAEKVEHVTNAFLKMKKFDLAELKKIYDGQ